MAVACLRGVAVDIVREDIVVGDLVLDIVRVDIVHVNIVAAGFGVGNALGYSGIDPVGPGTYLTS